MALFPSGNTMLNGILWGGHQWLPVGGPATVTYYFAHAGEFIPEDRDWGSVEQDSYRAALQSWASVANLHFTEVFNPASAGLIEHVVPHTFWSESNVLGSHETPDGAPPLNGYYNFEGPGWDETDPNGGLQVGGYGYVTLVHELGHGLGLAHPHDNGGGSSIWPGVTGPFDSYGDYNLNQGIFTIMSYNDGWDAVQNPFGHGLRTYGFEGGPSAFDVAAVQYLYGPNTSYHSGDNTHTLPDSNGPDTYWTCIWDAGGIDQIVYAGSGDATIDLRAATIDDSPTGGGIPSYVNGIYGGFTIANGVVIENASSGSGNDTLTGNSGNNSLSAGGGIDSVFGGGGQDTLDGGAGNDTLDGGDGNDTIDGGADHDVARFSGLFSEYTVSANGDGSLTVSHTGGSGDHGSDLVRNVEDLIFVAATDDTAITNEDTTVSIDVLANDVAAMLVITGAFNGAHGTVTVNDNGTGGDTTDDFVVYTPDADFNGTDSFTYTLFTGETTETATVIVTVNPVADIVADTATTNEDTAANILVQANDTFEDSGHQITATTNGAHGTATVNDNGTGGDTTDDFVVYTPDADFNGTDTFTYTVTSNGTTETARVSVTVNAVADIVGDTAITNQDKAANILVQANDTFEDSGHQITATTNGAHGTVTINDNGTAGNFADDFVVYTPATGFTGTDSFTYTVTSGGVSETATVSVTVQIPVSTTPTTGDDSLVGTEGPDTILGFGGDDVIDGLGGADILFGNQDDDTVFGRTGNDTVWGGLGNDSIDGAQDDDLLFGNEGQDTIDGGDGTNTIVGGQDSSDGADSISAGTGADLIWGNGGADTITAGAGANTVIGGFGKDSLTTGSGNDIIFGNEDSDTISAGDGANLIFGGFGDDSVLAGSGNDTVWGNEGNDTMAGATGADRYSFLPGSGNDQINGFSGGAEGDRLDLQGQSYTLGTSADGDVVLLLSGGGTIELNGIAPANFSLSFVL